MKTGLDDLHRFIDELALNFSGLLEPNRDIYISRAPARLDVMGGIADYSGAVVLEGVLDRATIVALQKRSDNRLVIKSLGIEKDGLANLVEYNLDTFFDHAGALQSLHFLRTELAADDKQRWAGYVLGAFAVLLHETNIDRFAGGATICIKSNIPRGVGIASSAALEVATMLAITRAFHVSVAAEHLALLCQKVENHIVGAPCGVMDQMTSALGQKNQLLVIKCQPAKIIQSLQIPAGYKFMGINSAVKHSISGCRYTDARVATFMGRKIIFDTGHQNGYLCNVPADRWLRDLKDSIPTRISGREFIDRYQTHDDPATEIDPEKFYLPRSRTEHPILENDRVNKFIALMRGEKIDETQMISAGKLMIESHYSYGNNCGLGASETDMIVDLVRQRGPKSGLFGAKITGGGSGGTVAVLYAAGSEDHIHSIASLYAEKSGKDPDLFFGSSAGAYEADVHITQIE